MSVFRVEKTKGYTIMSNHHLRNTALSLKAKGLLSQMLSLPEEWDYSLKGLSLINRESVDAIRSAVWELEEAGYIVRQQGRDGKGKMTAIDYIIYEQPQECPEAETSLSDSPVSENPTADKPTADKPVLENPTAGNPIADKPITGNPMSENPTELNKDKAIKDPKNTDISNTESYHIRSAKPKSTNLPNVERSEAATQSAVDAYRDVIKDNIEYEILVEQHPHEITRLDEIVDIMLEILCTARKTIRVAGDEYPAELVKSKLLKLNSDHIEYVFDCLDENKTKIRNIKKYLIAMLFNASSTIDNYYAARVNREVFGED
jgi:hypothetical protein